MGFLIDINNRCKDTPFGRCVTASRAYALIMHALRASASQWLGWAWSCDMQHLPPPWCHPPHQHQHIHGLARPAAGAFECGGAVPPPFAAASCPFAIFEFAKWKRFPTCGPKPGICKVRACVVACMGVLGAVVAVAARGAAVHTVAAGAEIGDRR
eukprot:scaffold21564_cov123-Isochrysis_galbana.AAC.3